MPSRPSKNSTHKNRSNIFAFGASVSDTLTSFLPSVRVELLSNRQAIVDGCKGIIEYSENCIRLSSEKHVIKFSGSGLCIKCFSEHNAIIEGSINGVEYY